MGAGSTGGGEGGGSGSLGAGSAGGGEGGGSGSSGGTLEFGSSGSLGGFDFTTGGENGDFGSTVHGGGADNFFGGNSSTRTSTPELCAGPAVQPNAPVSVSAGDGTSFVNNSMRGDVLAGIGAVALIAGAAAIRRRNSSSM
ncbi:hypothetical protein B2J88_33285 [Rhodococcus sp. SRB_17]|nr:hypothetical protein [Rhodococcus sp. SRB_17]